MTNKRTRPIVWLGPLLALAGAAGCAHGTDYTYVPVGPAAQGGPAARYGLPPAAPQGEAYVTSFGFTDFDVEGGTERLVHARLAVSNGSAATWNVDGRQQSLIGPGVQREGPSFLNTDAGDGPIYPIPPGEARVFDFYFAVPPALAAPASFDGFALLWTVDPGGGVVAERTDFQRAVDVGPSYAAYPPYVTVGLGFGVGWWYAPHWAYPRHYPIVRGYYYAPYRARGTAWRGPPPGTWHGAPPRGGGTWHGAPPPRGGGGPWRGSSPSMAPRAAPAPSGGGWHGAPRGGGGGRRGR